MSFSVAWSIVAIDKFTQIADKIKSSADKMGEQFEKLNKKVEKANKTVDKSANSLNRLGEAQNRVNRIFAIGAGIMSGVALKMSLDIEKAFNNTQSILHLPQKEFANLKNKAKEMSIAMNVPLTQVAKAMEYFGGTTEEELGKVKSAILQAKSQGKSVDETIDYFYNLTAAMELTAEQSQQLGDKLAYLSTISNKVDASVLDRSFSRGAAALLRHSDDLNSLLGITAGLGEAGIDTSNVTRSLIKVQTAILKPGKEAKRVLDSIQKSVGKSFFDKEGKLKKWVDIAEILGEAAANIIPKEGQTKVQAYEEVLLRLFGPQGTNILKSIVDHRKEILNLTDQFTHSASDYAQRIAQVKEQGLSGELTKIGIAFQGIFESIFDDKVRNMLADIIAGVRVMTEGLIDFLKQNPKIKALFQAFSLVLGVILPLGMALKALMLTLRVISAISLVGMFGAWGAAIVGLTVAIAYLIENWGKLNDTIANSRIITLGKEVVGKTFDLSNLAAQKAMGLFRKPQEAPEYSSQLGLATAPMKNELSLSINIKDRDNYVESVKTTTSNTPGFNLGRNVVTVGQ